MFELCIVCPQDTVDILSEALQALDALSVSVEDADALSEQERPLFGEPGMPAPQNGWQRSSLLALFATESAAKEALTLLLAQDFFQVCTHQGLRAVPEQDWVRLTQSQFGPVEITPAFWIVPTWHEPPQDATTCIRLDPGLAFGTGTHPTTHMCLKWIADHARQGLGRVLDYGCGSGILAIGAALHGAASVDAVDIDPAALEATKHNALANAVQLNVGEPELVVGEYSLVLANILAMPLKVLAPLLCSRLAPGASLVLAGILERQAHELVDAYRPYCDLVQTDARDGWILMTAVR
jgi:ribosomal protein L11 methyltransferase